MFGGKFAEAHEHGIDSECADRIVRLWFPWACLPFHRLSRAVGAISYLPSNGADGVFPVATIRFLADFPCPHWLVLKSQIGDLGLATDM